MQSSKPSCTLFIRRISTVSPDRTANIIAPIVTSPFEHSTSWRTS